VSQSQCVEHAEAHGLSPPGASAKGCVWYQPKEVLGKIRAVSHVSQSSSTDIEKNDGSLRQIPVPAFADDLEEEEVSACSLNCQSFCCSSFRNDWRWGKIEDSPARTLYRGSF